MSAPPSHPPPISELAGPLIMGDLLNWGLMGCLSVQVYLYHILFKEDPWTIRGFVYGVFIFEWIQTSLTTAESTFDKFVYNYGNIPNLIELRVTWFTVPIMCGIVSAAVQIFYARRIFVLSNSFILPGVVLVLAVMQGISAIVGGVYAKGVPANEVSEAVPKATLWLWLGGSTVVDIIIAITMTYLLLKTKSGIRRSDTMVDKLVRLVVESGTITAGVAVIALALWAAFPDKAYYTCPAIVLAKLYANVMVTSLNNRAFLQRVRPQVTTVSVTSDVGTMDRGGYSMDRAAYHNSRGAVVTSGATESTLRVEVLRETSYDDGGFSMKDFPKKHSTDFAV